MLAGYIEDFFGCENLAGIFFGGFYLSGDFWGEVKTA